MRQSSMKSRLWMSSFALATATLLGCGMFEGQTVSPEMEMMSFLKRADGIDILSGLEASYCEGQRCQIAVPVDWSGVWSNTSAGGLGIAPLGGDPIPNNPCPFNADHPVGFGAATCRTPASESGLSLCLPSPNGDSAFWGPCATTADDFGQPPYLEALYMLTPALRDLFKAKQPAAGPVATPTVASASWPAGPAKVCVAVAPNRGVNAFGFSVTTRGAMIATSTQGQGGTTSAPLCVDVTIPPGTSALLVRTTGEVAAGGPASCLHTFTSPDDSKSKPGCSGAFATTNGAVVGVAADTANRFDKVHAELLAWLSNKSR
ncbi:MAG: hypothetical protein IPG96_02370 [Proteobacteria bacterium]|nr:hypothetical protein [Pseudomonadota bacterium]